MAQIVAKSVAAEYTAKIDQLIALQRLECGAAQQRWVQSLELAGQQSCALHALRPSIDTLADAEFKVFSQWGEDGIIEWLLQQLPVAHETFIEFGVGSYQEANTRFLLTNRNWRGLILDAGEELRRITNEQLHWRHDIVWGVEFITRENIDQLFAKYGFSGEIGLLSIDMDGNDFWILEAITTVSPAILICEYNAMFGDLLPLTVPYDPTSSITKYNNSMLYFGASIAAMRRAAERKGYVFIGSCSNGVNAFFVRADLAHHLDGKLARRVAHPTLHRCCVDPEGRLATRSGLARLDLIRAMPVVHLDSGETVTIESLGDLFSDAWLQRVGHRSP
ncbi:MAG: hypothetical protein WDO24_13200 [Pseudomonadota bacterium]